MISMFDVYLVLQLDEFRETLTGVASALMVFAGVTGLVAGFANLHDEETVGNRALGWCKRSLWLLVPILVVGTLTPSSRTMAAMIILPALTSDEVIDPLSEEFKDLYALAKEALADAVKDEDQRTPEKEGEE